MPDRVNNLVNRQPGFAGESLRNSAELRAEFRT